MIVEEVEPVRFAATLRNRVRPVVGALQINFPGFLCTLGFNATRNGQRSFITNSHCTNVQGGNEATPYWQPTQGVAPTRIATEVADPAYTTGGGCPSGRRCRRSDAARARYASGTTSTLGRIARTSGANNGSLTITGNFTITAEGGASVGQQVHKIGRTTGWTRGSVSGTCVNTNVVGTNITQLCQTLVSAGVGPGDSGSPVFRRQGTGSNVTLLGILWGGSPAEQTSTCSARSRTSRRSWERSPRFDALVLLALAAAAGRQPDSMRVEIVVPPRVAVGEPVPITIRIANTADRPIELHLQGRTIVFDLIVRQGAGWCGGGSRASPCPPFFRSGCLRRERCWS